MNNHYHFIGIGGIGMSGLAKILLKKGCTVSGSDIVDNEIIKSLEDLGAKIFTSHLSKNVPSNSVVVYSTQITTKNIEFETALKNGNEILHRSDLLAQFVNHLDSIAVAGTHGKTTVTSLLAAVFTDLCLNPSYAVGGYVNQLQTNSNYNSGSYFIAEADESDGTFLKYFPTYAIITNIDNDHMNYYSSKEMLIESFAKFASQIEQTVVWCSDDPHLRHMQLKGISYGFNHGSDFQAVNFKQEGWHSFVDVIHKGSKIITLKVPLCGSHNVLNALSVFALCYTLGFNSNDVKKAIMNFKGVKKRCEIKQVADDITYIEDYGHHPTEIFATIKAVRQAIGDKRLCVIFQPHRYSRVKDCLKAFGTVFNEASELFVTDIYSAGEAPLPSITIDSLLQELHMQASIPYKYFPRKNLAKTIYNNLQTDDVVLSFGAGDINGFDAELRKCYEEKLITIN